MSADPPTTAVVRRVLPAPPEIVFAEWIDPEALAEFICPAPARPGPISCDPRPGGQFSIVMIGVNRVVRISGEYLIVERPHRLRFTWNSDFGSGFRSVVTVTLAPHGEADTLMTIEHARLPAEWRADHERGWGLIADQLEQHLRSAG